MPNRETLIKRLKKILAYILEGKFIRFAISGAVATLVDVFFLYILTEYLAIWYLLSACLSFVIGTVIHYFISSGWVFQNSTKTIKQYLVFVSVQLVGLVINLLVIYILVEFFYFWYILAKLVAVFVGVIWNFFANLKVTFKKKMIN